MAGKLSTSAFAAIWLQGVVGGAGGQLAVALAGLGCWVGGVAWLPVRGGPWQNGLGGRKGIWISRRWGQRVSMEIRASPEGRRTREQGAWGSLRGSGKPSPGAGGSPRDWSQARRWRPVDGRRPSAGTPRAGGYWPGWAPGSRARSMRSASCSAAGSACTSMACTSGGAAAGWPITAPTARWIEMPPPVTCWSL